VTNSSYKNCKIELLRLKCLITKDKKIFKSPASLSFGEGMRVRSLKLLARHDNNGS